MASSISSSLFITFFVLFVFHSQAREPQSFTKLTPSVYGDNIAVETEKPPQKTDPVFQPEKANAYGLFSQDRPGVVKETTNSVNDFRRYLPKNYNPVAYVTQPEEFKDQSEKEKYFAADESEELDENPKGSNKKYGSYESENNYGRFPQGLSSTALRGERFPQGLSSTALRGERFPQGMSDTRVVENGRYFYDVNADKFNRNHPYYETIKEGYGGDRYFNRRNYGNAFSGVGDGYQFNQNEIHHFGNWP